MPSNSTLFLPRSSIPPINSTINQPLQHQIPCSHPLRFTNLTIGDFEMHFKLMPTEHAFNNIVIGVLGGVCCLAIAGIYHLMESKDNIYHTEAKTRSLRYNFASSLYLLKNKSLLLMLPIATYLGTSRAFIYTKGLNVGIYIYVIHGVQGNII